jgi:hypothetical protein
MIELMGRSAADGKGLCLSIEHDRVVDIKPADVVIEAATPMSA